jgi:REP element-mobilizing transposase RayT
LRLRRSFSIARRSGAIHLAPRQRSIQNAARMLYRGFPSKLHHKVPDWVESESLFHIRIATDRDKAQQPLTEPALAQVLLDSARFYELRQRWYITLFLLMPDHLHALLSFERDEAMSRVIGDWKHFQAHKHGIKWQDGYFDHRLRNDERREQLSAKVDYIRQNPVVAGLCETAAEWPWMIERWIEPLRARC